MELKKKSRLPIYVGTILGITALAMVGTRYIINRIADKIAPALAELPKAIDDSVPDTADDKVEKPDNKGPAIPGHFGQPAMRPPMPGMGVDDGSMRRFGPPPGGKIPPGYSIKQDGPPMYGQPPQGMPMKGQPMPPPSGMGQRPPSYPQQPASPPPQQNFPQQPPGYPPQIPYPPPPYYPYQGDAPPMYPPPYEEEDYDNPYYFDEEDYESHNDNRRENNTAVGNVEPRSNSRVEDTQHTYSEDDDYLDEAF